MKTAIHAIPPFSVASSPSGAALLHMSGALLLVLAIILVLAWLARRSWLVPPRVKGSKMLTIVGAQTLGQRERLVVVEMANKHLLLGVTATKISRLAIFDKPAEEGEHAPQAHFSAQLRGWLKKRDLESEQ
jgi:flagellar biosynthetic protein FliO